MAAGWNSKELQVVQEWIARESQTRPLGPICSRICPYCCYRRTCVVSLYVTLSWAVLLGLIILTACGILIVEPWRETLEYRQTQCTVDRSEYTGESLGCSCGEYCRASYRCLRVTVTYTPHEARRDKGPQYPVTTILYESEFDRELSGTCTYGPHCSASSYENNESVEKYKGEIGHIGTTFSCLYNPRDHHYVIHQRHGTLRVLHVLLWPSLAMVTCVLGVVLTYLTCGCRYVWTRHPPEVIRQEAISRTFEHISISPYQQLGESV